MQSKIQPENLFNFREITFYKCQYAKQNITHSSLHSLNSSPTIHHQDRRLNGKQNSAFQEAQSAAKDLDKLYTPKPTDQLVITSDYAEKGVNMKAGISATLWALVNDNWFVVAKMSSELQPQQQNLHPCDGEATAMFTAAKTAVFRVPIKASMKKRMALVDSKPLVEAAKLLLTRASSQHPD